MKSVVITGASGFLGGALALKLLKSGVQVYGIGATEDGFQRFAGFENFVPIVAELMCFIILPGRVFLARLLRIMLFNCKMPDMPVKR